MRLPIVARVLVVVALAPAALEAQSDPASAEALFRKGRELLNAKKFADACPKLEESYKLDPQGGTAFALGQCFEGEGKTASAWARYQAALEVAQRKGQADRVQRVKARLAALEPTLPKLSLVVSPQLASLAGLEVKRDGIAQGSGAWGAPLPVDPGLHVVEASPTGKTKWETTIEVKAGARSPSPFPISLTMQRRARRRRSRAARLSTMPRKGSRIRTRSVSSPTWRAALAWWQPSSGACSSPVRIRRTEK